MSEDLTPVVTSDHDICDDEPLSPVVNDPLTLVVNIERVEPAVSKVFSPPWHPMEVFPLAAIHLPFPQILPLQTPPSLSVTTCSVLLILPPLPSQRFQETQSL